MNTADLNGHMDRMKLTKTIYGLEGIKTRDELLQEFIRDGYLRRSKLPDPDTDEPQFTYTWGPRAMVEVGHAGISAFIINVMCYRDVLLVRDTNDVDNVVIWR